MYSIHFYLLVAKQINIWLGDTLDGMTENLCAVLTDEMHRRHLK